MSSMRLEPVREPSAWLADELAADPSWRHVLDARERAELDAALRAVRRQGLAEPGFGAEQFPLPTLGPRLARLVDGVENGRGVALLQGVPVDAYDEASLKTLYWGIGAHAGNIISQNSRGERLAEVSDRGNDYAAANSRGFATSAELHPHVDTSDMTMLLCVRTARRGGESRVVSSTSTYNVVLAEHPEYLEVLYRGFHNDLRGEGPTARIDEVTNARVPDYSYFAGRLSCSFNHRMIEGGATKRGEPLTAKARAAIDFVREVTLRPALGHRFRMRPGDIQMVSNHSVFHSRTAFEDHAEPARRRCLYRLWVNIRDGRELAPDFADRYNTGPRGGVAVGDGAQYVF